MKVITSGLGLLVAAVAFTAHAEKVGECDARDDTDAKGKYALFCSKASSGPMGYAFLAIADGDSVDDMEVKKGFGLNLSDGRPAAAAVKAKTVKEVRESKDGSEPITLIVHVDDKQYQYLSRLIDEWSSKKEYEDNPLNVALNFALYAVKKLELEEPYRSGLSGPNPPQYFEDLYVLNKQDD